MRRPKSIFKPQIIDHMPSCPHTSTLHSKNQVSTARSCHACSDLRQGPRWPRILLLQFFPPIRSDASNNRQRRCHALIHLIIVDQTKAGTRLAPVCQIPLLGTWKVKSATKMDVLPTFLSRRPSPEGHGAYGKSSHWREGEI